MSYTTWSVDGSMRECHGGDPNEKKNLKKTKKTYEETFKTTGGLDDKKFDPEVYKCQFRGNEAAKGAKRGAKASEDEPAPKRSGKKMLNASRATKAEHRSACKLQAAFRGFHARSGTDSGDGLSVRARARSEEQAGAQQEASDKEVARRLRLPEYRQIKRSCRGADVPALAAFDVELERTVGLGVVKQFCASLRRDCLARAALGDPPLARNVLISGPVGTGKKLAAQLICKLLRAVGHAQGMVSTETTLDQLVLDVRRDVNTVIVEGLPDNVEGVKAKADSVIRNFASHCFLFVGSTHAIEALNGGLGHFRRVEPAWLQLPPYTTAELAQMAEVQLRGCGYELGAGLDLMTLQQALSSTWPRDVLAMRNAHLAREFVQRAISKRNARIELPKLLCSTLSLSQLDLGLDNAMGLQSLQTQRAEIEKQVSELVGMASLKRFLGELRAKVEYVHRGGDPRLLEGCLNVVLTGNPGAGKTTAARLLFRWLRAYGLLQQDVFLERNALELKGTHIGWTCPQVKDMVQGALGGCLFLDEAYALSGSHDGDRGDSFSDEALRTLLTEIENNRSSLCVVLAGYKDAMSHLMRADPGLVRRFPNVLHLDDYTPEQLSAIAKTSARERYGLSFAPGLEHQLAAHIGRKHSGEIPKHNASLSVSLVEAAMNRLAARLVAGNGGANSPRSRDISTSSDCGPTAATMSTANALEQVVAPSDSDIGCDLSISPLQPSDFLISAQEAGGAGAQHDISQKISALGASMRSAKRLLMTTQARFMLPQRQAAAQLGAATRLAVCGNPGTDTVGAAKLYHELLVVYGALGATLTERSALPLIGEATAVVAAKLHDMCEAAEGGMLLLHDAGALVTDRPAARALAAALQVLPPRTGVLLLGQPTELSRLLAETAGLSALFPQVLRLDDLSAAEVVELIEQRAPAFGLQLAPAAAAALAEHVASELKESLARLNGALADALLHAASGEYALRTAGADGGAGGSTAKGKTPLKPDAVTNGVLELGDFTTYIPVA